MKTKQLLIAALLATGMTAQAQNEPLDLSTVTAEHIELTCTADGWTFAPIGGTATPFDGVIKGGSKDAPLNFNASVIIRNQTANEAVLTFDNANLNMSSGVGFMTNGTDGKVTINLKDARMESSNNTGLIYSAVSCCPIGVKVDESSDGPSKLIGIDQCCPISFADVDLIVDGGTKGLEIEAVRACINNVENHMTITGKVTAKSGNSSTISSYNSTGLTIGEEVVIASGYQNAISIGAEGVALNPLFHWKYKTAPVAGKLVIKADGVEKATFTTDGKLKSFGIGGVIGKEYTVYYTPDGGTEKAQQDADGTTAFKADANGLMEYSGMMESTGVGALNLSTLTGDAILACTDGKWKYVVDEDGATELPFSGVIKGGSKDTELAFEHGLLIRKRVNGASVLTFDNVNLKLSNPIKFQTDATVDLLTVNLKDSKITGKGFSPNAGAACGPILIQADPSSTTASTIDTGEDSNAIGLAGTPLTLDGGTAGLTLIGRQAVAVGAGKVELKGKLALIGTSQMGLTMNQPCTDLSIAEGVTISGKDGICGQATWTSAALQWKYINAPAAGGTVEVKSGNDVIATFTTDGNRRYFGIGAALNKEYAVWYAPAGGTATQQQDNTGTSVFKATANGLLAMEGMEDIAPDGIQNTEATAIPAISYVYSVDGRLVKTVPAAEYSTLKNGLDRGIYIVNGEKMAVE